MCGAKDLGGFGEAKSKTADSAAFRGSRVAVSHATVSFATRKQSISIPIRRDSLHASFAFRWGN